MAQCQSGRHYGIPGYKQWADELWRRYRNGEPLFDGAGAGTATDAGLATLQDTHGKEVETVLKGVSTDDPEEDVAGVRSFHILSVLRFIVNEEYSVTTEQSVDECYRYTTAKTTPGVAHANTSSPHSAATPRSALRSMAAHRLLVLIQATTVSSTRMSSISLFLSSSPPLPLSVLILNSLAILTFYSNALCAPIASDGSDSLTLTYPGTDNLSATQKGNFNDRLLSYNCFKEEGFSLEPPELGTPPNIVDGGKTQ